MTRKQKQLLDFLKIYIAEKGYAPSFDEMRIALCYKSKSGIFRLLDRLEERGHIRRLPARARAIEIIPAKDHTEVLYRFLADKRLLGEYLSYVEEAA